MKSLIRKYWFFLFLLLSFLVALTIALCIKKFHTSNQRDYFLVVFKNSDFPFPVVVHGDQTFASVLQRITSEPAKSFQESLQKQTITHLPWEIISRDVQVKVQWKF